MKSMSLRLSPRALRGITSFALIATLFTGFSGSPAASAATYGSASFRGDAMLIGSNMPAANSNDFTYEFYFKMNSLPSLAGVNTVGGGIWLFTTRPNRWNPGGITLFVNTNGSLALDASDSAAKNITSITSPSATVAINNWYHLAITRSGNIFKVWVNGTQVSTGSALSTASGFSGNYNSTQLGFGEYLPGNISNFRFTTGTALYTSTFTPPTTQLTANGTTQVLIPFESDYTTISSYSTIPSLTQPTGVAGGSAYFGGTGYQDATGNLNAGSYLTNNGVTFSPTNPYGEKSICFGGNQARYFDYTSGEKIGTSSFTLEMWVKPKSWSSYMTFLNTGYGSGNGSYLGYNVNTGPRAIIFYTAEQLGSSGPGVPLDTWSHVAIVRDQVTMKVSMYINGSKVSDGNSTSYDFSNSRLSIGNDFNGCMTSVRLAKSALYTSNFTPTALGTFSSVPDGTNVMVALSAKGVSTLNTGTAGLMQGTGTITYEDLPKLSQTITFGSLGNKTLGMSAFALSASSSSGQSATFTSATSGTCTVSGSTVTLVSAGTCTINADQAGNVDYDAATQVQQSFTIYTNQSALVLSAASGRFGSTTTLATTGGSGSGSVSYDVVSGNCSVAGDVLSATSAGNCVITATKASDGTYGSITSAQLTIVISNNSTISYSGGAGVAGTLPSAEVKLTNETITVGSDSGITKTGYTFAHWSNGISSFSPGSVFTVGAADETLTAQWTINSYAITFDANGGSGGTSASLNYNVDALTAAPTVTKSQYIFAGWAETVTATSINSWTVTGSKTLYSLWTPKVYTIIYLPESGTATVSSETFTVGTSPIVLQTATRSGYKFHGWFTSKTGGTLIGTAGAQFTPTDTATVHAQWIQASLVGLSNPTSFGTIVATNGNDGGISATRSGTKAEIEYFADSLPDGTVITAYLQGSTVYAASQLTGVSNLLLSVVVAWKALDETVPLVDPTKSAIRLKITNPDIKRGAKVYSIVGDTSTVLTTAAQDGYVVIDLREDPEIVIANPVIVPDPPAPTPPSITVALVVDNSAAEKEAKLKAEAEAKSAAELKVAQELAEAALKAAREKAEQELKDALAKADEAARLKAEADAKLAAELKAIEDAALAAALAQKKIVPNVTLYSISPTLKLSTYDRTYLNKYVSTLRAKSTVTCIGYIYAKNVTASVAKSRASKQATAICAMIKSQKKSITTKVVLYPSWKAPKAAAGAKWVAVSYRVDGFKS
jgi:uncharacterized repeat protein (TIGR02543 family)